MPYRLALSATSLKHVNKPMAGLKAQGVEPMRYLREVVRNASEHKTGDVVWC